MPIDSDLAALNKIYKSHAGLDWRTAYLGDGDGVIYDPTQDGNVFVRFPASDGNLTAPVSVRLRASVSISGNDSQQPVKVGRDKEGKLAVLDIDFEATKAHGVSPLDANAADKRRNTYVPPANFLPLDCHSTSAPGALTTEVFVYPLIYIADGTVHFYPSETIDLAASIPGAGLHRLACLFLKDDDTIETIDSTAKSTLIPMGEADVQECIDGAIVNSKPAWAWLLKNNQASISNEDRWLDLRQRINASSASRHAKTIQINVEGFKLGATAPTPATVGIFSVLQFAGGGVIVDTVYATLHLPMDWAAGTDLTVSVHWAPIDGNAGDVKWQMTWSAVAAEADEVISGAGTSTFIIDATQTLQDEMLKSGDMTIAGASLAMHDCIAIKLFRNPADGADTYASAASLIQIEFSYIADN